MPDATIRRLHNQENQTRGTQRLSHEQSCKGETTCQDE